MSVPDETEREAELLRQLTPEMHWHVMAPIRKHLPMARWGFRLNWIGEPIRDEPWHRPLIFDSPRSRIKFVPNVNYRALLDGEREPTSMTVLYARSNVPDEVEFATVWREKRCFAWHDLRQQSIGNYLEGRTPRDLRVDFFKKGFKTLGRHPWLEEFRKTQFGATPQGAERDVALQAFLWERYGEGLFSLFDVGQPEKWEELRKYIRKYYKLVPWTGWPKRKGNPYGIKPWDVC